MNCCARRWGRCACMREANQPDGDGGNADAIRLYERCGFKEVRRFSALSGDMMARRRAKGVRMLRRTEGACRQHSRRGVGSGIWSFEKTKPVSLRARSTLCFFRLGGFGDTSLAAWRADWSDWSTARFFWMPRLRRCS